MSDTRANAEIIKESGAVTDLSSQAACMERESLPTGMLMPSAGQSSIPTAFTVSNKAASSPGCPHAAIQLADNTMSLRLSMAAAAILVMASPIAIRPEAGALSNANGVRSPIAIASPVTLPKVVAVTAQSATGTCQGPTI